MERIWQMSTYCPLAMDARDAFVTKQHVFTKAPQAKEKEPMDITENACTRRVPKVPGFAPLEIAAEFEAAFRPQWTCRKNSTASSLEHLTPQLTRRARRNSYRKRLTTVALNA